MSRSARVHQRRVNGHSGCVPVERKTSVLERHFWLFGLGVVLVLVLTRTFDFSLLPPTYNGVYITRPFCGLHSWDLADRAWGARSHVKYGLRYTKGCRTLVVGDPPPAQPQYYVNHPALETWVLAAWMLVFGTADWSFRLADVVLAIPALILVLYVLRRLYGSGCALLAGLLLAIMPLPAFFGFNPPMCLLGLWALYRYLILTGRLGDGYTAKPRHLLELAIVLFVLIQFNWVGVFYAFVLGAHYVLTCILRRQVTWPVLATLAVAPLLSLTLNFYIMLTGFHHNLAIESASKAPAEYVVDRGGILPPLVRKIGTDQNDTAWGLMKTLYQWRAREGEVSFFSWRAWVQQNLDFARTNFTIPILLLLGTYLLYLGIAHLYVLDRRVLYPLKVDLRQGCAKTPRSFNHLWFHLLPALLFLFTFKGLFWRHQFWQAPFTLFIAIGTALALLSIGSVFERVYPWLGRSIVTVLIVMLAVLCNHGLAQYRAVRWHSIRTIDLFKHLNREIPPDKALLTFRDFTIQQNRAKVATYREEYAWYLDREMIVANAWQYNILWVQAAKIEDAVAATVQEVQQQARTGRCWRYYIPARERYPYDPFYSQPAAQRALRLLPAAADAGLTECATGSDASGQSGITSLSIEKLDRSLNDDDYSDDQALYVEKHRRYREALIARLKELYPWEYYDNPALPGDTEFCENGVTPCHLFDLTRPRSEVQAAKR